MANLELQDKTLMPTTCRIGSDWCEADGGKRADVTDPASGDTLGSVPDMGTTETRRAIAAADAARADWAGRTAADRAELMRRLYNAMVDNIEDLAAMLTAEGGKPLSEARGEIKYSASFVEWFAEEGKRLYGDVIPAPQADKRIIVTRQPVGVAAAITPWNFPSAMLGRKLGAALAAGCTLVCKPATETPFSALALAELADRVGIPPGVINIVTGSDARVIGGELTSNWTVRKLSFTGSTAVGKKLMSQCADTVKRVSLELGGNAPFIVFDDADIDAAVAGAVASKFRNSGQTCVCANRFLVQRGVHDKFVAAMREAVGKLTVGDGREAATDLGPLISEAGVEKVEAHVADARDKGAELVCGGQRHALGGTFFEPTLLTGVTSDMRVADEETFGPVVPVFTFDDEAQAIAMANATTAGLAAYFYTNDVTRSVRVDEALAYGIVGLNTGVISTAVAPFGGIKESGMGSEGSKYGLLDYTTLKYSNVGGIA